jgi:hypothetical protein
MKRRNWYIVTATNLVTGETILRWPFRERVMVDTFDRARALLERFGLWHDRHISMHGKKVKAREALGYA